MEVSCISAIFLFISKFATVNDLALCELSGVLAIWQGLGYNRRAKYLKAAAEQIVREHRGKFPKTVEELVKLPGVGKATASAVLTYAFNKPIPFIETNIRTVFIHHFFDEKMQVTDSDLLELVSKTLDTNNPREWNFALMDYGTHLKQTLGNKSRQSAAYAKQSIFKGSWREKRGKVIRLLVAQKKLSRKELAKNIILTSEELDRLLDELMREGMITREGKMYSLG